jgi:Zn-dependent protease
VWTSSAAPASRKRVALHYAEPVRDAPDAQYLPDDLRGYDPLHPQGLSFGQILRKIWGGLVAVAVLLFKFGFVAIKFFGIFLSFGGYALIWGWKFALGFILLILVHESGHYFEARRQGLKPSLPRFIPFLGAYVTIKDAPNDPWRNALISIAGPAIGGVGAVACWAAGAAIDSRMLYALAYSGFLLNLFNLIPFVPLDGGFIVGAARALRRPIPAMDGDVLVYHPPRQGSRGLLVWAMYLGLAALLVLGMIYAHVPQDRL